MKNEIKVVVTGAAGQIGYSLIPRLIDGNTFGDKTVNLSLVEIPQVVSKLEGLAMELDDSYFPNLGTVNYTDNFSEAADGADWFLLVGSIPRGIVYNGKRLKNVQTYSKLMVEFLLIKENQSENLAMKMQKSLLLEIQQIQML